MVMVFKIADCKFTITGDTLEEIKELLKKELISINYDYMKLGLFNGKGDINV